MGGSRVKEDKAPRVVGLGVACLDYLFVAEGVERGAQARLVDYAVEGGGLVGTALVAAARLGARVEIVSWVGDDEAGRLVVEGLEAEGVDTSGVEVIRGGRTGVSFVRVEAGTGERTIHHRRGSPPPAEQVEKVAGLDIRAEAVLVDGVWPEASVGFARRAREAGTPVVGDFCPRAGLEELAALVTALIVPKSCGEGLGASWEARLGALARYGPEFVGITAGEDGCHFLVRGEAKVQPAFAVEVVDTTGAGDVFHGAFAYGLAAGWGYERCVEFAAATAALSCRALGGRTGIPARQEVDRLLRP